MYLCAGIAIAAGAQVVAHGDLASTPAARALSPWDYAAVALLVLAGGVYRRRPRT